MGEKGRCWWLGGHENVNLDVSEAIYSSLGISSGAGVRRGEGRGCKWTQFKPHCAANKVL